MTASADRRRSRTVRAVVLGACLTVLAGAMLVVGGITLANSKEGELVGIDDRARITFPSTPNAVVAVTDDDGRLTSMVVMTLLPSGQGGSIVTLPVNADSTAGFGVQRRPLDQVFDADDPESVVASVEEMLSITVQRVLIVDPAGLDALLAPIDSLQVVLPQDVIDSSEIGASSSDGLVVGSGPQTLDRSDVVAVLTAVDDEGDSYDHHEIDVEMWAALAQTAPLTTPPEPVTTDAAGAAVAPASAEELVARMWQGEIGVRDIALATLVATHNPTDDDVVLLDRRDSSLVFAQVSPGLVTSVSTGPSIRVVAAYTDEQIAQSGGLFATTSDLLRLFIGQMLTIGNTVVSVEQTTTGARDTTLVEVTDETLLADVQAGAEALFGQVEVRLADTVVEGVDIQVTLGMSYIVREMVRAGDGVVDENEAGGATTEPPPPDTVTTDG